MAVSIANIRLQDSESDVRFAAFPTYLPTGLTVVQYQAWITALAPLLDAVTGSVLVDASITVDLTLPGGLKATPVAGALNERGGLIGWDTTGNYGDSQRIPAILQTIMTGDSFSLSDADIVALTTLMQVGSGSAIPTNRENKAWVTPLYGKKSFRRK